MNRGFLAAICLLLPQAGLAADYLVDARHTRPVFRLTHPALVAQFGRFTKVDGQAIIDFPARKGRVDVTIQTGSLEMAMAGAAEHLLGEGLLDVEHFPSMTFAADKLVFRGGDIIGAEGRFTMLGITKPLAISVIDFRCEDIAEVKRAICSGEVAATLLRSDYGLTRFTDLVDDRIDVRITISIYRARCPYGGRWAAPGTSCRPLVGRLGGQGAHR